MEREFKVKKSGNETVSKIFVLLATLAMPGVIFTIVVAVMSGNEMFWFPAAGCAFFTYFFFDAASANRLLYNGLLDVPGLRIEVDHISWWKGMKFYVNGQEIQRENKKITMLPSATQMYLRNNEVKVVQTATCMINGTHTLLIVEQTLIMIDDIAIMSDNKIHESRIYEALGGKPVA